ncbi:iron-containing alcohol dehydrogenase [Chloroflexota bacterium]
MITTFNLPTKIIFGAGSLDRLGEEAAYSGRKALIVTYPDIRRIGLLDMVQKDLRENGVDDMVFDEVEPNPRSSTVDKGARIVAKEKVDLVIGLGGGSAMDTAKAITLASTDSKPIWYYAENRVDVTGTIPSIIQVPTIAGTGSEVNAGAVITNWETHQKTSIPNRCMWAKTAIIDPELTLTVPKRLTASGGVDIFSHLVENYLMPEEPLPVNDAIREALMKVVVRYLPRVLARLDDIEARTQLSWASTIAMSQIIRLGGTVGSMTCHGIEHAISGYYDVTHGEGLAALLPAWMKHILPVRKERLALLARNVFEKTDGIRATEEWLEQVGMRLSLRDLGCELERAEEIANITVNTFRNLRLHPRTLDIKVIAQIYRDSF